MTPVLKKRKSASSILGLSINGSRLSGVTLRRQNNSLQVQQSFVAPLALSTLTDDPELVGRDIRNQLDKAEIRERRCVVCLPANWALSLLTELPELPEEDLQSFLQIEAERSFPYALESLQVSTQRFRTSAGKQYAMMAAIPRSHVLHLEKALKAARLTPVGFALGINALQLAASGPQGNGILLTLGENNVDLQVTFEGGITALRALEPGDAAGDQPQTLHGDVLIRELRITLGQLPADCRTGLRKLFLFGEPETTQRLLSELAPRLKSMNLTAEVVGTHFKEGLGKWLPANTPVSPALSLAAEHLTGTEPALEFLPPKVSPWQQWRTGFSSKKLLYTASAVGAVVLLVGGAFLYQQYQLSQLNRQWAALAPRVQEMEDFQGQIRKFRPWFDDSYRTLTILRRLTEAFPKEGTVTAKTLEIHELHAVTCSGSARDNQSFLKMLEQLRATKEVSDLKVDQFRGKAPLQFTFNFHWGESIANENQ